MNRQLDVLTNFISNHKYQLIAAFAFAAVIKTCKSYFAGGVCKSKARLDGKTVIITGANTGIGKETALDLAKRGARVILACRDLNKANKAAEEIREISGNGNVIVKKLDLASLASVKAFADEINAQEDHIDILINNAGLNCPKAQTTDGYDMTFQSNHLGHFLLTNLLLDKIKKSGNSRIIVVSSGLYKRGKMHWDDLMLNSDYRPIKAYSQSKLANVLFTRELAKRVERNGVTVNALHPGLVNTEITRPFVNRFAFAFLQIVLAPLLWLFVKSPKEGAQTSIYLAVSEDVKNVTGQYFVDCKQKQLLPHALSDQDGVKLWEISENYVKKYL